MPEPTQPSTSPASSTSTQSPGALRLILFFACLVGASLPWSNPALALTIGIVIALAGLAVYEKQGKKISRFLIQACVVLLGFRVNLGDVAQAAAEGVWLAIGTIVGTLALGFLVAKMLRMERDSSLLVSTGTAICGGSAIAAVGSSIGATSSAMAVATGAVFILNAIALYVFPSLGHALHLTTNQFGTWCGVAVHDMSSVAGAATAFDKANTAAGVTAEAGKSAADIANIVKMTRVLWIAPIAIGAGWWWSRTRAQDASGEGASGSKAKKSSVFPWFILYFLIASAVATFVPQVKDFSRPIKMTSAVGFQAALFLIGCGLSKKAMREVGWRALVLAIVLWVGVATSSLAVIRATIH